LLYYSNKHNARPSTAATACRRTAFTDLAKPGGQRTEACARGQRLILAPWEHHNERIAISRNQCLSLNDMASMICEQTA